MDASNVRRVLLCVLVMSSVPPALSQGPLAPPGAPLPTMKSLDEVEARIIVNAVNATGDAINTFIISQPGSYYLAGNVSVSSTKHGISIQADGVTLDLNGFAVISAAGSGSGIGINVPSPQINVCVRNGTVRGWRGAGVAARTASSSCLERLRVNNNAGDGAQVGNESAVRDCVLTGNGGGGLSTGDRVLVTSCVADVNSGGGLKLGSNVVIVDCLVSRGLGASSAILVGDHALISRCTVSYNGGKGIETGQHSLVIECNSSFNTAYGVQPGKGSTVRNCTIGGNTSVGIVAIDGACQIIGNTCDGNGGGGNNPGMVVGGLGNRIEANSCTNNFGGFSVVPGNLVIRNSAQGNNVGAPFSLGSGGAAPVIDVSGNQPFPTSQPWANLSY